MQRGCAGPAPRGELGPTCATGYEENRHRERHRAAAQGENARQGCGIEGDEATGGRRGRQQAWARERRAVSTAAGLSARVPAHRSKKGFHRPRQCPPVPASRSVGRARRPVRRGPRSTASSPPPATESRSFARGRRRGRESSPSLRPLWRHCRERPAPRGRGSTRGRGPWSERPPRHCRPSLRAGRPHAAQFHAPGRRLGFQRASTGKGGCERGCRLRRCCRQSPSRGPGAAGCPSSARTRPRGTWPPRMGQGRRGGRSDPWAGAGAAGTRPLTAARQIAALPRSRTCPQCQCALVRADKASWGRAWRR